MIGRIITKDITSKIYYTIIGLENGQLIVRKVGEDEYTGPCPPGHYITIADVHGMGFNALYKCRAYNYIIDDDKLVTSKLISNEKET